MKYIIDNLNKEYRLAKTSGANYEAVRMLRLKFIGTTSEEKFSIIQEFKLIEEYKEITDLKIRKEAFEDSYLQLKNKYDAAITGNLESAKQLKKNLTNLEKEIKEVNEKLALKDAGTISVKEYYEQAVQLLFEEKPEVKFEQMNIAEVNHAYNDFFFSLTGNTPSTNNA